MFFLLYLRKKIIVFKDKNIPINYFIDDHRLFRSSTFHPTTTYLDWLNKIQAIKGELWKRMDIFDLIQLSRVPIWYSTPMLWASLYFFNKTMTNFHFPCRMFGPTLFDLASIAGLASIDSFIDLSYFLDKQFSIVTKPLSYNRLNENDYKELTSKVFSF